MALTFADTYNMIAHLTKSDASEGFEQILDFLNASVINYALTVNPTIYVSCIKQFWSSVLVKKVNEVVRLQALIDRKKVIITEDTIQEALHLDDAKSIDCLPNEEIFTELATMVADDVISADVADVVTYTAEPTQPSPTPTTTPPPPLQDLPSTSQVTPTLPSSPIAQTSSSLQQQPSQPTIISMDLLSNLLETCTALTRKVKNLKQDKIAQALEITKLKQRKVGTTQRIKSSADIVMDDQEDASKQGGIIADIDADEDVILEEVNAAKDAQVGKDADVQGRLEESQAQVYHIDLKHNDKVLSMQDDEPEPTELKEVIEVLTTAKLMTEVVTAAATTIT
nr:hypothetical protein [Tanacetum cinerariifolium]